MKLTGRVMATEVMSTRNDEHRTPGLVKVTVEMRDRNDTLHGTAELRLTYLQAKPYVVGRAVTVEVKP